MWAKPVEAAVHSLLYPEASLSVPPDTAIRWLQEASGENFGNDAVAWIRWAKKMQHLPSDYPEKADNELTLQENARRAIALLLPDADIRTDQCNTVRVYWRDICGGVRQLPDGGFFVTAGDASQQDDNLVFESSYSERIDNEADAIDRLASAYKSIDCKRD
jgi:hypothetical protein